MKPSLKDGDKIEMILCEKKTPLKISDLVLFKHPFKKNLNLIKRITKIKYDKIFVESDNHDTLSTDDSHNFGCININKVLAIKRKL